MVVLALSRGHPVLPPPLSLPLPYDIAARLEGKHCTPSIDLALPCVLLHSFPPATQRHLIAYQWLFVLQPHNNIVGKHAYRSIPVSVCACVLESSIGRVPDTIFLHLA